MRRIVLMLAVATGCFPMSVREKPPEPPQPSLAAAARVDQVGRQLLAANTFTGLEVGFQVVGSKGAVLLHADRKGLFISDSLVDQCKSDGELAAVLATELAKMMAEERSLARMGYDSRSEIPESNAMNASDLAGDPVRLAEAAIREKNTTKVDHAKATKDLADPHAIAADLLKTAGHDPKLLDTVQPYLKNLNKDRDLVRQLTGGSGLTLWSR